MILATTHGTTRQARHCLSCSTIVGTPCFSGRSFLLGKSSRSNRVALTGRTASPVRLAAAPKELVRQEGAGQFRDVDRDLWAVLEMATEQELQQVYDCLHGRSLTSPLLKTLVADKEPASVQLSGRLLLMYKIEQRFRFLAADSITVLRGQRPSYRDALLKLRDRLSVHCVSTMPVADLEVEIFLAIVQRHTELVQGMADPEVTNTAASYVISGDGMANVRDSTAGGASKRVVDLLRAPLKLGAPDFMPALVKFFSATAVSKMSVNTLRKLAASLWCHHTRYEAALSTLFATSSKGLAGSMQRQAAVQAAQSGLATAAARYTAARSALSIIHPIMWTWLGLDLALMALGTDYGRLSRAVFELAQIRLLHTHGFTMPEAAGPVVGQR